MRFGVPGIDQERPDLLALVGKFARWNVAPRSVLRHTPSDGAGEYHAGVGRMHEDRVGLQVRQHVLPLASRGRTAEDADLALLVGTPDIAGHAGIDVAIDLPCDVPPLIAFAAIVASGRRAFTPPI